MTFTYDPPSHQICTFPIILPVLFIGGGSTALMWEVEGGTKSDVSSWVIVPEDESLKSDLDCGSFEGGCSGSWGRGIGEGGEDVVHKEHVREELLCGWDLHSFKRRFRRRNVCLMFPWPHTPWCPNCDTHMSHYEWTPWTPQCKGDQHNCLTHQVHNGVFWWWVWLGVA